MDLVFRTAFVFLLIFGVTRAVGRRELSSMEPFDMILLVVIGDLVQQGVTQSDYSLTGATTVIATLALLTVFTASLSFRVRRLRPLLEGEPVVIVADGDVLVRNLRRQRMTVEEVEAEARQQQIASLDDVRFAVLETNGRISFATRGAEGGRRPQGRQDDGEQELDAPARRTERPVGRVRRGGKYARCGGPDPSTRRGSDARRGRHA